MSTGELAMAQDLIGVESGRSWRGNLHCHSNRSDGQWEPERIVAAYRDAGYDFIVLPDHFEANYGWRVTDTRAFRDEEFTTIIGAELSSGSWTGRTTYWVVAAGIPVDFDPPPAGSHAEAIQQARDAGAFVVMLHPGLNNLPLAFADDLPCFGAVDAVEIYNHYIAVGGANTPDLASGAYFLDGLLERGRRLLVTAGDDAHFRHPRDRFGAWVEVQSDSLDPESLLASLKAGRYYSTQGPALRQLVVDGDTLHVESTEAYSILLSSGGDTWHHAALEVNERGAPVTEADFDLSPFRGSFCRVTVIDADGRRAWSNPIWP